MWRRWLEFIGKRSGPDLYVLVACFGAVGFGFGRVLGAEEAIGGSSVVAALGIVIGSRAVAHRRQLDVVRVQAGTSVCFACRGMFAAQEMRKLSGLIALLGPVTWAARQNYFCQRCARRQHAFYITLVVLIVGGSVMALLESVGSKAH